MYWRECRRTSGSIAVCFQEHGFGLHGSASPCWIRRLRQSACHVSLAVSGVWGVLVVKLLAWWEYWRMFVDAVEQSVLVC
jgi:hypothetical protein